MTAANASPSPIALERQGPAQELRQCRSAERHLARRARRRRRLDPWLLRLRQIDLPALHQPSGNAEFRRSDGRRRNHPHGARRATEGSRPADRKQVDRIRSQLGMVFQSFNLWSHKTMLENVIEAPVHVLGRPQGRMHRGSRSAARQGRHCREAQLLSRPTSPAASSSAPQSPARSPCGRR